uniref:Uncharacterized protein n=1 Tax=Trichogramma kaykai TaxID=54128 RepID=A0ABD2XCD1_9HYME
MCAEAKAAYHKPFAITIDKRTSAQAAAPPRSVTRLALYCTIYLALYMYAEAVLLSSPLPSCHLIYDIALQWAVQLFAYAIFHSSRKIEECVSRSVEQAAEYEYQYKIARQFVYNEIYCSFVIYTHSYVCAAIDTYIKGVYRVGGVICSSRNYQGQLPNLRDIFRPEAIDWLLTECVNDCNRKGTNPKPFVDFVIATGYKDEPKVDKDGKPMLRRTTAVHRAKFPSARVVPNLFEIYDRFDLNYIDESGRTHFHVGCSYGCDDAIEKFLENGANPNCHVEETGDSPLHLALSGSFYHNTNKICRMLLENGADLNSANAKGLTPLHGISMCFDNDGLANMLFEISEANRQTLQIDARDNSGNTPLHEAVMTSTDNGVVEFLLRRGADPNLANEEGFTSLHLICKSGAYGYDDDLAEMFFNICDENHKVVQVDALDKLGRTPLQWAVANLLPNAVNLVLKRGADLSRFVFPILNDSDEFVKDVLDEFPLNGKLGLASRAMIVVEHLEKGGYNLNRGDALKIMTLFAKYDLYNKSSNDVECCNSFRRACRRNFQRAARLARQY